MYLINILKYILLLNQISITLHIYLVLSYVSQLQGFAFIEFNRPEDAQKCINTFTKMGCKLPTCTPPEDLSSIKMYTAEEPSDDLPEKKVETDVYEPPKKKKRKDKKAQKNLELKLGNESDTEKRVDTPTPTVSISSHRSLWLNSKVSKRHLRME